MSRALEDRAFQRGVQFDFIRPGKPVEDAFIDRGDRFTARHVSQPLAPDWLCSANPS